MSSQQLSLMFCHVFVVGGGFFSYWEVSETKLQNDSLSVQGSLYILNETDITKKAMWIYTVIVWKKQRSWLKRLTEIYQPPNLKWPSGRYSTYAFWLQCRRNSKDQPFYDPRYEHLAKTSILHNFGSLQRHRLAWITNRKHSSQLKVHFCHWDTRKLRKTDMQLGEEKAKQDCFFSTLEAYDANIYAWGWEEFLGHPSTLSKNIPASERRAHNRA